jgi:hypothetical protein
MTRVFQVLFTIMWVTYRRFLSREVKWRAPEFVASRVLCIEKQFEISRVRKMIGSPVRRR